MRSFIKKKQDISITYEGYWTGLDAGEEKQEDISDYANGAGKFGHIGQPITLTQTLGSSALSLKVGIDFQYNKRLDASVIEDPTDGFGELSGGIVDFSANGALGTGKVFRILDNGDNIKNNIYPRTTPTYGLKVYAKDLSTLISPPSDRIYVDPLLGKFVFPRPTTYCIPTSWDTMANPAIGSPIEVIFHPQGSGSSLGGGSIWFGYNNYYFAGMPGRIFPRYNDIVRNELTITFGISGYWAYEWYTLQWYFFFNDSGHYVYSFMNFQGYRHLYYNIGAGEVHFGYLDWYAVCNITIAIDGTTLRVFQNGTVVASATGNFTTNMWELRPQPSASPHHFSGVTVYSIKAWNELLSNAFISSNQSPENSTLHPMYGSANSYVPKLINPGKVAYKYIPASNSPASLLIPGTSENTFVAKEDISDYNNGVGFFGTSHQICKENFTAISITDFYYDEALDGSGIHAIDIYDDGIGGSMLPGKIIRIVNDNSSGLARNVTDPAGLNLKPIAKSMVTNNWTPKKGEVYIDPMRGKIIMPRPTLYAEAYDIPGIINADMADMTFPGYSQWYYPFGNAPTTDSGSAQFSITCSAVHTLGANYISTFYFQIGGNTIIGFQGYARYDGYTLIQRYTPNGWVTMVGWNWNNNLYWNSQLQINWDFTNKCADGKMVNLYYDGTLLWSGDIIPTADPLRFYNETIGNSSAYMTFGIPLKIWNHNIGSYLPGADSLHPMYGSANGYKPKISALGGVGHYKASSSGSLVKGKI